MNDAKTDETTLRALTSRFDAIQAAAARGAVNPYVAKLELEALEREGELTNAEAIVFWTRLALKNESPDHAAAVKYAHARLVARVLAYFDVPFP